MTTPASHTSDETIYFPSMAALRAAHSELLKRLRGMDSIANITLEAEVFIRRGKATGSLLDTDADRWEAQSKLDYWATQIYQPGYEPPDAILDEFDPELAPAIDDGLCPYMGLDAFQEANQSVFFGRERLVSELIDKLKASRFLAVLGPSGSGKSSLVRAGLIPELKKGALRGSADWTYLPPMVPGSNPLQNLARLMTDAEDPVRITLEADGYRDHPGYLAQTASETVRGSVVLVVDQFEEIFTLCTDDIARSRFVENLVNLCQTPGIDHYVIITMRSDFEMNIVRLPALEAAFEQNAVRITPLAASELRDSIEAPAERIGLKFEEGVVNSLVSDTLGEPAALPLLQFTLLKLWEKREHNRITRDAYQKLGGGRQALARSADEFYKQLIPEEQTTMRRILLKMVRPGEGLEVTSNRVPRAYLYHKAEANDRIDRVLDRLIRARLIRKSQGDMVMDDQLEIAHEALIRNWPTLVEWLDEERVKLRQRHRLTTAAEEWQRLNRATSALWRRELLQEALRYDDLNELERQFVNASHTRQRFVRTARVIGSIVLVAYLLIAAFFYKRQSDENAELAAQNAQIAQTAQAASLMANEQRRIAEENANEAQTQAKLALASRLASQAQLMIETHNPKQTVAALLAVRSMQLSTSVEASQVLQDLTLASPLSRLPHDDAVFAIAIDSNGQYVISGGSDRTARVWEVGSGGEIARRTFVEWVNVVAFSPDNRFFLAAGCQQVDGKNDCTESTIHVGEVSTGEAVTHVTQPGEVYSIKFGSNNEYVVSHGCNQFDQDSYCNQGIVWVWELDTGKKIAQMLHDGSYVHSVALSPDDQYVVSSGCDQFDEADNCTQAAARVWETMTGTEIARMTHDNYINAVAFSPDGRYVVSGGDDGIASIWETTTGLETARIFHDDWVTLAAFSPDGKHVVSGSDDGTASIWETTTWSEVGIVFHEEPITTVAISPDSQYVVSAACDLYDNDRNCTNSSARVAELETGEEVARFSHDGDISSIVFSQDGRYATSTGCESYNSEFDCLQGVERVWDTATWDEVAQMTQNSDLSPVVFSPDGQRIISGSKDGAVIWKTVTEKEKSTIDQPDNYVADVAFSWDGNYVISNASPTVWIWDSRTGNEVASFAHDLWVSSVSISSDNKYAASGGCDKDDEIFRCTEGVARIWEIATEKEIARRSFPGEIYSISFSPNNRYLAIAGCDQYDEQDNCLQATARVWEPVTGQELASRTYDLLSFAYPVTFSPDSQYMASAGCTQFDETFDCTQSTIDIWKASTGEAVASMNDNGNISAVSFSPDGKYVVSGSENGAVRVWEASSGRQIAHMVQDRFINTVIFSPDGKYILTGSDDSTARIWDISTGQEIARMTHDGYVYPLAFSPDGRHVVSGGGDITVRVWETGTGKEIARITHQESIASAEFSPDGKHILSASYDGTIQIWRWQPLDFITSVCSRLSRNLTSAEWKQYMGNEPYEVICPELPIHATVIVESIMPVLLDASSNSRVEKAIEMATELLEKNSQVGDPGAEAEILVKSTIQDEISRVANSIELENGNLPPSLTMLENAELIGLDIEDAYALNSICWFGSIYGYAKDVLSYCEQAVELARDDAAIRDSRGLARALTGDYPGAIEDFQAFIDSGEWDEYAEQRRGWIQSLEAGNDPFTQDELETLKDQ